MSQRLQGEAGCAFGSVRHLSGILCCLLALLAIGLNRLATGAEAPQPPPAPPETCVVRSGDTLERIARRYLGDAQRWPEIAMWNGLAAPYTIRAGQRLRLKPVPMTPVAPVPPAPDFIPPVSEPDGRVPSAPAGVLPPLDSSHTGPALTLEPHLWWLIPLGILIPALASIVSLRIACWFALVETSFFSCFLLSIYLLLLLVGFVVLLVAAHAFGNSLVAIKVIPVVYLVFLFLAFLVMKRTLGCQWRSTFTILIMWSFFSQTAFIGCICVFVLSLGLLDPDSALLNSPQ